MFTDLITAILSLRCVAFLECDYTSGALHEWRLSPLKDVSERVTKDLLKAGRAKSCTHGIFTHARFYNWLPRVNRLAKFSATDDSFLVHIRGSWGSGRLTLLAKALQLVRGIQVGLHPGPRSYPFSAPGGTDLGILIPDTMWGLSGREAQTSLRYRTGIKSFFSLSFFPSLFLLPSYNFFMVEKFKWVQK